jgi:hypothetical protein
MAVSEVRRIRKAQLVQLQVANSSVVTVTTALAARITSDEQSYSSRLAPLQAANVTTQAASVACLANNGSCHSLSVFARDRSR